MSPKNRHTPDLTHPTADPATPSAPTQSEATPEETLNKYGITRVSVDHFYTGGFRYTNLEDAIAQAKESGSKSLTGVGPAGERVERIESDCRAADTNGNAAGQRCRRRPQGSGNLWWPNSILPLQRSAQRNRKDLSMSRLLRLRIPSIATLALSALLAVAPGGASAQDASMKMPENARASIFREGWVCERGYRKVDGGCTAVKVPPQAFATDGSGGQGWECSHGYREVDGTCVAITVPPHAFLNAFGDRWECDRGYQRAHEACVAIKVPPHAFLNTTGDHWECDRGYRQVDETCVAIKVPQNGHLVDTTYGSGWECDRGYREVNEVCEEVVVPANAYFLADAYELGWKCDRGYRQKGAACVALTVPANAHIDYSGNGWECNRPYARQADGCVLSQ